MLTLAEAIDRVLTANTAYRKRRALSKPERALERAMRAAFKAEGQAFEERLGMIWPRMLSEVRIFAGLVPWEPVFDDVAAETEPLFVAPIDEAAASALEAGASAAIADIDLDISFDLRNPRAVEYMRNHGAEQVAKIRETTRNQLRTILTQAVDEGWSYDQAAKAIRARYRQFGKERSRNIAIYELGDAYEAGNRVVADDLVYGGLIMEKSWLSAGDAKVRPEHRANAAAGWIPIDENFPSGHDRPPTDARCRCAALYRRKPDA